MPNTYPNLMDVARRSGDPSISAVVEVLNKANPMIEDIPWKECNSGSTHITTIRTGIPTPTWRLLNSGVPTGKSTTKQIKASCGMCESYAEVDKTLVDLAAKNGQQTGAADFIASENKPFIEGFGQELARTVFYGDASKPQEPLGLINFYNKLPEDPLDPSKETNVINGGGSGSDNTSIWLVNWSDTGIHGIYPQGTPAGLKEQALGEQTAKDEAGGQYQIYRTHYQWFAGIVVRDWRSGVRIANVDFSDMVNTPTTAASILTLMTKALYKIPASATGRQVFYMRKELVTALDLQCQAKSNLLLTYADIDGKKILQFRGVPIKQQDTLLTSETVVA